MNLILIIRRRLIPALIFFQILLLNMPLHAQSFLIAKAKKEELLSIGQTAPPFKVAGWVHNKGVDSLAKGQVYLVEITAINCAGCRLAIPHLTKLSNEYNGRVKVLSVYVGEGDSTAGQAAYLSKVRSFIRSLKVPVDFSVGVEYVQGNMYYNWDTRFGLSGFPHAFIVNRAGIVCWLGNPNGAEMRSELEQVVRNDQYLSTNKRLTPQELPVYRALHESDKGNYTTAIRILDSVISANPGNSGGYAERKLQVLLEFDEAAGYAFARTFLEAKYSYGMGYTLAGLAAIIRHQYERQKLKSPDWELAFALVKKARQERAKESTSVWGTYTVEAEIAFVQGDFQHAVDAQQQAISSMKKYNLDEYQTRLGKGAPDLNTNLEKYKTALQENRKKQ